MAISQVNRVIQHLYRVRPDDSRPTDGVLLEAYLRRRDDTAVATLVRRHGPMVWGVCRRVLRNYQDAEDAFQATFLVLLRKAASIGSKELLANWLYGTARLTALKARALAARRNERERQVPDMPEPPSTRRDSESDVRPTLDEELSRLPDRYRAVIVLCDLEGCTRKEAAGQLGCPEGTVASRLTRARAMLAKRLRRRGVALSAGAAAVLAQQSVSAVVPNSVVDSAINSARMLAAGKAAAAAIPVRVTALSEEVMKTMLFTKLKATVAVILVFGFAVTWTTILADHKASGSEDNETAAKKHVEPSGNRGTVTDEEDITAWGKEVGGLRAGLSVRNRSDIQIGGKVAAVVKLRNVGTETITVSAWPMWVTGPRVVDTTGKPVRATSPPTPLFEILPTKLTLKPGQTIDVEKTNIFVVDAEAKDQPFPAGVVDQFTIHIRPGKYRADFRGFLREHPTLATGTVDFDVKAAERDGFTAWGKDVGGLQAGLGYDPGQKRAYHPGETVRLVIRVRNVGKEAIKFEYLPQFLVEVPPAVTDGQGRQVGLPRRSVSARTHQPIQVNLSPGKETVLYDPTFELRPASKKGADNLQDSADYSLYGMGRFQIHYARVLGNSSAGVLKVDPTLSKLATGKLELEVSADPPAGTGKETPQKKDGEGTAAKPIKIRVYIENVNAETSTITASCMLIGEIDAVTKPLRLENLRVAEKATIRDGGKEVKLADLKSLPRDTHYYLSLKAYEEELGFEVVGIETIRH